jgi:hypothetical protein
MSFSETWKRLKPIEHGGMSGFVTTAPGGQFCFEVPPPEDGLTPEQGGHSYWGEPCATVEEAEDSFRAEFA